MGISSMSKSTISSIYSSIAGILVSSFTLQSESWESKLQPAVSPVKQNPLCSVPSSNVSTFEVEGCALRVSLGFRNKTFLNFHFFMSVWSYRRTSTSMIDAFIAVQNPSDTCCPHVCDVEKCKQVVSNHSIQNFLNFFCIHCIESSNRYLPLVHL